MITELRASKEEEEGGVGIERGRYRCCVLLRVSSCFLSHTWVLLLTASLLFKVQGFFSLHFSLSETPFLGD